ncbi:MAG: hypothetical protein KBS81_11260 [Spirochaetales bacterium]|nr:hypothetical protein [Candidatus Physcosoma equi]
MDYNTFYEEFQMADKNLKDKVLALAKIEKTLAKDGEKGDIKDILKCKDTISSLEEDLKKACSNLKDIVTNFDYVAYLSSGEFSNQLLLECQKLNIDVIGEFPVYQMFPYKLRIDSENQEVFLDRKKLSSLNPAYIAKTIKEGQEKLNKVNFNAEQFANELENAYLIYYLKKGLQKKGAVALKNLYKELIPMARFKKEYDEQAFSFDVARLYNAGNSIHTKSGASLLFGTGRNDGLRILDTAGREVFVSTLEFIS